MLEKMAHSALLFPNQALRYAVPQSLTGEIIVGIYPAYHLENIMLPHPDSPTFGECFFVSDVSGRSNVLIHAGNWAGQRGVAGVLSDTEGCILVGDRVRVIEKNGIKQPGVNRSKDTLKRLLKRKNIQWAFHSSLKVYR